MLLMAIVRLVTTIYIILSRTSYNIPKSKLMPELLLLYMINPDMLPRWSNEPKGHDIWTFTVWSGVPQIQDNKGHHLNFWKT